MSCRFKCDVASRVDVFEDKRIIYDSKKSKIKMPQLSTLANRVPYMSMPLAISLQ
jgi:hypothetical protein